MNQELISVISAFFGSLGFSIIYNIRGLRIWIPAIGGAVFWAVYLIFLASVDKGIHNKTTKYGLPTY